LRSSLYGAGAEYALHSLLILSGRSAPVSVRDLASFQQIPERFLAKVFTRLEKAKIVKGLEGVAGGFVLARAAERLPVLDILSAVDPDRALFACAEIRRHCALFGGAPPAWSTSGMCRVHLFMREAEGTLQAFLASKTLAELGREFEDKAPQRFLTDSETWFQQRRGGRTKRRPSGHGGA
jgi:Rrf2 family protein